MAITNSLGRKSQRGESYTTFFIFAKYIVPCSLTLTDYEEKIRQSKRLIQPEIRITQHISQVSLLTPLLEQDGEGYSERGSSLRRHSISNGRSIITDMQLLTVTSRMHSGLEEPCETIDEMRGKDNRALSQVSPTFESKSC